MSSDLGASTRLRISKSVYARPFGDELVVLDFARGEYFALDEIGACVWRAIENGEPLAAIATSIAGSYDVDEAEALRDIVTLSNDLLAQNLVERV